MSNFDSTALMAEARRRASQDISKHRARQADAKLAPASKPKKSTNPHAKFIASVLAGSPIARPQLRAKPGAPTGDAARGGAARSDDASSTRVEEQRSILRRSLDARRGNSVHF